MRTKNILLGCRATHDFCSHLDNIAERLNIGRSETMRIALTTFVRELTNNELKFNQIKSQIF